MKRIHKNSLFFPLLILLLSVLLLNTAFKAEWGFYGHKRINRLAVFTLPPDMIGFYKKNIDYITEHSVDPDKRRYASKFEAIRHYIDVDHWGEAPFPEVPRKWTDALAKYLEIYVVQGNGDTAIIDMDLMLGDDIFTSNYQAPTPRVYKSFVQNNILPIYYEDDWSLNCDSVQNLLNSFPNTANLYDCQSAFAVDQFSGYGVLPYHLVSMQRRLTNAFKAGDTQKILRLSADFGHYLGDAHVPLHTTENYNGQMTNQVGIHGFWESRLPELFADKEYDYFVGQAEYFDDPTTYYWDIILKSHTYVKGLLAIEKDISAKFPSDQQFCYDQRGNSTILTQCEAYSRRYHDLLDGQVERRMTKAIRAIGSAWLTAWVDAGQPNLDALSNKAVEVVDEEEQKELNKKFNLGKIFGRQHGS